MLHNNKVHVFLNFITIILTLPNSPGIELYSERKKSISWVYVFHKTSYHELIWRRSRAFRQEKTAKNCDARAKLLLCLFDPFFMTFALLFSLCIDLVTVLEAILTGRQPREKLQCLYENLMSNNFRKTAVLKKNMNCKWKLHSKGFY